MVEKDESLRLTRSTKPISSAANFTTKNLPYSTSRRAGELDTFKVRPQKIRTETSVLKPSKSLPPPKSVFPSLSRVGLLLKSLGHLPRLVETGIKQLASSAYPILNKQGTSKQFLNEQVNNQEGLTPLQSTSKNSEQCARNSSTKSSQSKSILNLSNVPLSSSTNNEIASPKLKDTYSLTSTYCSEPELKALYDRCGSQLNLTSIDSQCSQAKALDTNSFNQSSSKKRNQRIEQATYQIRPFQRIEKTTVVSPGISSSESQQQNSYYYRPESDLKLGLNVGVLPSGSRNTLIALSNSKVTKCTSSSKPKPMSKTPPFHNNGSQSLHASQADIRNNVGDSNRSSTSDSHSLLGISDLHRLKSCFGLQDAITGVKSTVTFAKQPPHRETGLLDRRSSRTKSEAFRSEEGGATLTTASDVRNQSPNNRITNVNSSNDHSSVSQTIIQVRV